MVNNTVICDNLLISLRKIIRAIDLHSKQLQSRYGITGPQMLVLKTTYDSREKSNLTSSEIANSVSLSQATVTVILDKLVNKEYITRTKSQTDKRKTYIQLTPKTNLLFEQNPTLLQETFVKRFSNLKEWEKLFLGSAIEKIADMMNAEEIDASPILSNDSDLSENK